MTVRRGMTRDDYVAAALEYVDEHGAASLTARNLGEHLGVDPTAVYRHFSSLSELCGAVVDRVLGSILDVVPRGRTPRERLAHHISLVHDAFYEHPNVLALLLIGTGTSPNAAQMTGLTVSLLEEMGLTGQELVVCHQMLESYIIGSHLFDLGGAPDHLAARRGRLRSVDLPVLDRQYRDDKAVDTINRKAFAAGIEALLDYCEAKAEKSRR